MIATKLKRIRHVALDMDGTIYKGKTLFDFTPGFLARLRGLGIGYTFLTNNSSKSRKDYLSHLAHMGVEAQEHEVYTSALSTVDYLRDTWPQARRLYVLGTPSLQEEFRTFGFDVVQDDAPEVVVVGFDADLTYFGLCRSAWWIQQGKPFVATHPDRVCPTDLPTVLVDCGAVCACLQSATGRAPDAVLGKPDPRMLTGILHRHGLRADELAMCGDRIYTDVAMAHRAGALGVLVLTGEATLEDVTRCTEPPDVVAKSLAEFGQMLAEAKE